MFAVLIPVGIVAQEQKGDIDFNIGISTPGLYSLADVDLLKPDDMYYYNYTQDLGGLQTESYNSNLYPSISAEITYKLADSGFFKRVSLAPGESKEVELEVPYRRFALWDAQMKQRVEEGWFELWLGRNA
ncbi:MAG: fibronectin type III-like domain-contianing protein, partial [Paludibacteraceae bacterium]|nr:fibronectin type III-like domain-contianing protein [Paludibacteraceae bacterium]